uniref:PhoLip_ATPase_C domain-containing protein n=1 Tax=Macrostomum lignano TaxID=282301 RepID=A0A1I8HGJ7_9PLAT
DAAYWPLWVNITVPLLSALAFAAVQALLLFVDDPGLRSAKRAVSVELGDLNSSGRRSRPARAPSPEAAAEAGELSASGTDAAVQCDLLRPAASTSLFRPQQHHLYQVHPSQQQNTRQRTVSFGALQTGDIGHAGGGGQRQRSDSETMRMLEGMLLRPTRRHTAHSHQHLTHLSENDSRIGAGAIIQDSSLAPATQSLTGQSGQRLLHSVNHYYQQHQRLQARQMRYSTPVQPNWRPNADEQGVHVDMPVPPTPPSSDRGDD